MKEIGLRVREYENQVRQSNFGLLEMENELMRACQTTHDPHSLVLMVYAMAKMSMGKAKKDTNKTRNLPLDVHFPAFQGQAKDPNTSVSAQSMTLAERFGYLLWSPRDPFEQDVDDTPLHWALEAVIAKKVIQFIVAWHIVTLLVTSRKNKNDGNSQVLNAKNKTTKHSLLEWLDLLGNGLTNSKDPVGNGIHSNVTTTTSTSTTMEIRDIVSSFRSFRQNKFTLEGLVSYCISPYLVGYPFLEAYVAQALSPPLSNGRRSSDGGDTGQGLSGSVGDDENYEENNDDDDDSYSFCLSRDEKDETFSWVGEEGDEDKDDDKVVIQDKDGEVGGTDSWEVISVECSTTVSF